jgi:hypothetical protein
MTTAPLGTDEVAPAPSAGSAGPATIALRWLIVIALAALFVQFALAGFGAFTTLRPNHPHGSYQAHEMLGQAIGGIELLTAILALVARRRTDAIIAAIAFLLVTPGQQLLANAGHTTAAFGALHGLVGVVILALTGVLFARVGWRGTPR